MVDINYTLLIQLANFIFLIIVLNALLLKPVLRHMAARDNKVAVSHEEAKEYADRAESMLAEFEAELADTRVKANQRYHGLQQEGITEQRARLSATKGTAQEMVEKARGEIDASAKGAREILKKEMEKLPGEIASKLLGRAV
jgi:F-type H+-transporting ATPase subunit b